MDFTGRTTKPTYGSRPPAPLRSPSRSPSRSLVSFPWPQQDRRVAPTALHPVLVAAARLLLPVAVVVAVVLVLALWVELNGGAWGVSSASTRWTAAAQRRRRPPSHVAMPAADMPLADDGVTTSRMGRVEPAEAAVATAQASAAAREGQGSGTAAAAAAAAVPVVMALPELGAQTLVGEFTESSAENVTLPTVQETTPSQTVGSIAAVQASASSSSAHTGVAKDEEEVEASMQNRSVAAPATNNSRWSAAVHPQPPRLLVFGAAGERTGDRCAGLSHTRSSLACAVAIAAVLNRTLVLDRHLCLNAMHVHDGVDWLKPVAAYFDLDRLPRLGVQFVYRDEAEGSIAPTPSSPTTTTMTSTTTTMTTQSKLLSIATAREHVVNHTTPLGRLLHDAADTLVLTMGRRGFTFEVCKVLSNQVLLDRQRQRHRDPLHYNPALLLMADTIAATLAPFNFTAVHVRRGDKAKDKARWPNLDRDTQPAMLLQKLPKWAPRGSHLYIASDEPKEFFAPLRVAYKLYFLDDFAHLWEAGSAWHRAYLRDFGDAEEPEFDAYMRAAVDYTVLRKALVRVETFNDLTSDPRRR